MPFHHVARPSSGLLSGQQVLVGPQYQALLEAQTEYLHQPKRRSGVPVPAHRKPAQPTWPLLE
jgi:hypothetical protein